MWKNWEEIINWEAQDLRYIVRLYSGILEQVTKSREKGKGVFCCLKMSLMLFVASSYSFDYMYIENIFNDFIVWFEVRLYSGMD